MPLRSLSQAELAACRPQAVIHLHLTDVDADDQLLLYRFRVSGSGIMVWAPPLLLGS